MALSFDDAYIIQWTRGTSAALERENPLLLAGQPGYELDTGRFKVGDGRTHWNDLDYYLSESEIGDLVRQLVAEAGGSQNGSDESLLEHINSLTPHPVYDDGPSLLLLYENAKV